MCRACSPGRTGRRCPSQNDPAKRALAVATQLVTRWERRLQEAEIAGDDGAINRALLRFTAAVTSVAERTESLNPFGRPAPPSRVDEFSDDRLAQMGEDELIETMGALHADPAAQDRLVGELDRRDQEQEEQARRTAEYERLSHELTDDAIADMDYFQQYAQWEQLADYPDLQNRVAAHWADSTAFGEASSAESGDTFDLTGEQVERLDLAYRTMSPAAYQELERTIITDPALRSTATGQSTPLKRDLMRREKDAYMDYMDELYVRSEHEARGHMLNARGQALKVDPVELMFGNSKRMSAYASDEFKASVQRNGGHMSFTRWLAERGHADAQRRVGRHEEFLDVANV